jgi:hypothetical protein
MEVLYMFYEVYIDISPAMFFFFFYQHDSFTHCIGSILSDSLMLLLMVVFYSSSKGILLFVWFTFTCSVRFTVVCN